MVVGRGYFSHASSHSENLASACRVTVTGLAIVVYGDFFNQLYYSFFTGGLLISMLLEVVCPVCFS